MMYTCSENFNLDSQQLRNLEKSQIESSQDTLEENEAQNANHEDFDPISDDEEIAHKVIEDYDVAGEKGGWFGIVMAKSSPVNDHDRVG